MGSNHCRNHTSEGTSRHFFAHISLYFTHNFAPHARQAAKTASGEKERLWQAKQLLESLSQLSARWLSRDEDKYVERGDSGPAQPSASGSLTAQPTCGLRSVPIILTGDLNATPDRKSGPSDYESLAYPFIKQHALRFRSVMNDDLPAASINDIAAEEHTMVCPSGDEVETLLPKKRSNPVWTSWKTRWRAGQELVVKHCIDYILYCTAAQGSPDVSGVSIIPTTIRNSTESSSRERSSGDYSVSVRAAAVLETPGDEAVGPEMLPSAAYPSDHISLVADFEVLLEQHD